jgi:putative aminopeptidase
MSESNLELVLAHLERLAEVPGAPGHEDDVVELLAAAAAPHGTVVVDAHGSAIVTLDSGKQGPTLLVAAHADEIALVVSDIDDEGFLRVGALGSVVPDVASGRMVRVAGHVGIVGTGAGHFKKRAAETTRPLGALYVDVGATSAASVRAAGIGVGTPVTFLNPIQRFGLDRAMVAGKAIDDRLGCALALTLLQTCPPPAGRLVVAFTVQEEVGLRGAGAVAARVRPDLALAVDTIACGDTPDREAGLGLPLRIGAGPVLPVATGHNGGSLVVRPRVAAFLEEVARDPGVALQRAVFPYGDNDATTMAWAGTGCHAASLAVARRYSHSPVEAADVADVAGTYAVLRALVQRMASWPTWLRYDGDEAAAWRPTPAAVEAA